MEQWKNVVIVGIAGTPQFDGDLDRAGRDGFEGVGIAAFGGQLTVLLRKKVTITSVAAEFEAFESESRPG